MATEKRLIDAKWLTSQMYLICEVCQTENIFIDAIIDEIDNAPRVDAVEVVHGQWIKRPDERICPFCNDRYSYFGGKEKNFCSNCGAKMMDGDGNVK